VKRRILIIDDEPGLRKGLGKVLELRDFIVLEASGGAEALTILRKEDIDLALLDLKLEGENGLEVLRRLKAEEPLLPVIMITAYGNIRNAVECLKAGAINYISKPIDGELLVSLIEKEIASSALAIENLSLKESLEDHTYRESVHSLYPAMQELDFVIQRVKDSPATVLILGESGTGKEVTARTIHYSGIYREHPFIGVNCAALNDNLLESELFGHEKGAFTGAVARKLGRFEMAGEGTLFLDEVGDMSLAMQAKLLRVLQERSFERVGGTKSIRSRCRVIAASNKKLEDLLASGAFREDLYYRLSLVVMRLPPLRERPKDIELLIDLFIRQANLEYGRSVQGVSPELMQKLKSYSWPGNLRQLKNVITNAIILIRGETIDHIELLEPPMPSHAGEELSAAAIGDDGLRAFVGRQVARIERQAITRILAESSRNLAEAARRLKISRKTLYEKIRLYGL
jgi:DNA-binding NtrC family response regulator